MDAVPPIRLGPNSGEPGLVRNAPGLYSDFFRMMRRRSRRKCLPKSVRQSNRKWMTWPCSSNRAVNEPSRTSSKSTTSRSSSGFSARLWKRLVAAITTGDLTDDVALSRRIALTRLTSRADLTCLPSSTTPSISSNSF